MLLVFSQFRAFSGFPVHLQSRGTIIYIEKSVIQFLLFVGFYSVYNVVYHLRNGMAILDTLEKTIIDLSEDMPIIIFGICRLSVLMLPFLCISF